VAEERARVVRGIAGTAADRPGRHLVDCLNTGYMMRDSGLLTYGHDGPWDLDDANDENRFTMEAWGRRWSCVPSSVGIARLL
jgi:hypothetical protein